MELRKLLKGLYYKSHDGIVYKVLNESEITGKDGYPTQVYVLRSLDGKYSTSPVIADYSAWRCVIPDSLCIIKKVK